MFIPFSQLPSHARVWVYQANRNLQGPEIDALEQKSQEFAGQWTAHKVALNASATVVHSSFLILGIDENIAGASGCSIDSSVQFIREMEKQLDVIFLDRTLLAFLVDEKILRVPFAQIKEEIAKGHVTPDTLFFNNLVQTKSELEDKWLVPASNTWLTKYFASSAIL